MLYRRAWLVILVWWGLVASAQAHLGEYRMPANGDQQVVVIEQVLEGVRPEMLDWWWNNMASNDYFQRWHPQANQSAYWQVPPASFETLDYAVGAVLDTVQMVAGQAVEAEWAFAVPPGPTRCLDEDHRFMARIRFPGYPDLGAGLLRYDYVADPYGRGTVVRVSYALPAMIDAAYPGYSAGIGAIVESSLANLNGFLPEAFQQEYIEGTLLSRGNVRFEADGWLKKRIIVEQEIAGITADKLDWWWDNINSTARYQRWHPTAHVSFEWLEPPAQADELAYSVGAVQLVSEYIGPYKSNLLITWLEAEGAIGQVEYDHWIYAKTDLKALRGIFPQRMIHEYQDNESGDGIVMRSIFTVPSFFDLVMPGFSRSLGEHAIQEMQFLPRFLPELFRREFERDWSDCGLCTE